MKMSKNTLNIRNTFLLFLGNFVICQFLIRGGALFYGFGYAYNKYKKEQIGFLLLIFSLSIPQLLTIKELDWNRIEIKIM
ncbi:hypothetical protein BpHYR1_021358 [Brachionus plicatilis]|uniref:Uncharacterized protein n=1 Tax=Brachionus plicatilis TaxID=10195 RepID=A0A3M7Q7X1_BRAPC|nr:hypothetical protein BpHYR1_021358 [Brachionus plicatilis]